MKTTLIYTLALFTIALQGQVEIESSFTEVFVTEKWHKVEEHKYEYDINKNLTLDTFSGYDPQIQAPINSRTSYSYNANNMVIEVIKQTWIIDKYENSKKEIYEYENDNLTSTLYQKWESDAWKDTDKEEVIYDSDNILTGILAKKYSSGEWINFIQITDSYSSGYISKVKQEKWKESKWENYSLQEFRYNSNNRILGSILNAWNALPPTYYPVGNENYDIDNDGNLKEKISESQLGKLKYEYNYDSTSKLSSFSHPFKDKTGIDYRIKDFPYLNGIEYIITSQYNPSTTKYDLKSKITYNYSTSLSLSDNEYYKKISLYPNPTVGYIKLNGLTKESNISIYNLLGSKIIEKTIQLNEEIDVQNLTKGIYFLKIENGSTLKFIKK